ncbi:hypothetical protein BC828DRAFT_391965 [Blastocladiella britannica]|nr:hypothetical protein BC828DRAFT_391965 [Blastocladiella britannica]
MPYPKTRTTLLYDAVTEEVVAWGYPAASMAKNLSAADAEKFVYIDRVKLLLDEKWAASPQGEQIRLRLQNRSAVQIIADFLCKMLEQIRTDFAASDRPFDIDSISWVLTVPAMWTDKAKDHMREAAFLAGMTATRDSPSLILCLEPEAALLSSSFPPNDMAFDDVILSVDVGGGTADMSAMVMTEDATAPFGRKFNEVVPSRGTVHGSIIIDTMFERYIEEQVGPAAWVALRSDTGAWAKILAQWVSIKHDFDSDSTATAELTLSRAALKAVRGAASPEAVDRLLSGGADAGSDSDDDDKDAFDDIMYIPVATLRRIIGPVVEQAIALAIEMMRDCEMHGQPVTKVVVVGGFAGSRYLVQQLRAALHQINPAISVFVPSVPGSAVLTGAVLYGMAPKIVASRVLQRTYGFAEAVPTADTRFESTDTSEWAAVSIKGVPCYMNVFTVLAEKDQSVSASEVLSTKTHALIKNQESIKLFLFAVDEEVNGVVIRTNNPVCKPLGIIEIATTPGSVDESFEVKFEFGSSEIKVHLTSTVSGETQSTLIHYDDHQ